MGFVKRNRIGLIID